MGGKRRKKEGNQVLSSRLLVKAEDEEEEEEERKRGGKSSLVALLVFPSPLDEVAPPPPPPSSSSFPIFMDLLLDYQCPISFSLEFAPSFPSLSFPFWSDDVVVETLSLLCCWKWKTEVLALLPRGRLSSLLPLSSPPNYDVTPLSRQSFGRKGERRTKGESFSPSLRG